MDNELLVKSVRDLCKKNNIPISQLESELNFGAGLISRWTKSSPSLDKIVDIADYYRVTLDEVVGRKQKLSDDFLNILCRKTEDKTIEWQIFDEEVSEYIIKPRPDVDVVIDMNYSTEISYFTAYANGFISIYCLCYRNESLNPIELYLYIQPSSKSNIVEQNYSLDELKPLWIKILKSLSENAPDDIRAEDLKNNFINEFKNNDVLKKIDNTVSQKYTKENTDTSYLQHKIDNSIKLLLDSKGSSLYDMNDNKMIKHDLNIDVYTGWLFYTIHRKSLGKVIQVQIKNDYNLFLISNSKIMKLSLFDINKNNKEMLDKKKKILQKEGFDRVDENALNQENLILYS